MWLTYIFCWFVCELLSCTRGKNIYLCSNMFTVLHRHIPGDKANRITAPSTSISTTTHEITSHISDQYVQQALASCWSVIFHIKSNVSNSTLQLKNLKNIQSFLKQTVSRTRHLALYHYYYYLDFFRQLVPLPFLILTNYDGTDLKCKTVTNDDLWWPTRITGPVSCRIIFMPCGLYR